MNENTHWENKISPKKSSKLLNGGVGIDEGVGTNFKNGPSRGTIIRYSRVGA